MRRGHIQSASVVGITCALIALYAIMVTHIVEYDRTLRQMGYEISFRYYIEQIVESGFSIGRRSARSELNGMTVYLIWVGEALLIGYCVVKSGLDAIRNREPQETRSDRVA